MNKPDESGKRPFCRKFKEGPFKELCFRSRSVPDDGDKVVLEFYGGHVYTVSRVDYMSWAEKDC